jgi:peptidyl-prolyl cis-trans isomerase D
VFESVTKKRKNPIINIFGWTLLIVVCIVFVFIGFSPNSQFLGQGGAAAEVNGDAISLRDFKELLDRLDNNGQATGQDARRQMNQNAMNILVSRTLMIQEANKLNIHVSDKRVGQELLSIQPFFEDGVFSRVRYKTYLRQAGLTEAQFEDRLREDLIIQKMSQLIGYASKDLDLVDDFDKQIDQAQINVGYVKIDPRLVGRDQVNNQAVTAYVQNNKEKVAEYYNAHQSEYIRPEEVKARHILIKAKDQKPESFKAAHDKIKDIAKNTTVENFSQMAEKHSEDPGSKTKGGDLGFFPRGRMVPEFEKAAFTTEKGQITEPIKTKYGYHILLVDEKKSETKDKLEQVEKNIARKLLEEEAYEKTLDNIKESLKARSYDKIEELFNEKNWAWKSTGFFPITRESIPGVGNNKEFLDLALELGPDKEYGERLVYQGESAYLIKFKGAKMESTLSANPQMDFFKQLMKQRRVNTMVQSWTDSLREKASVKINPDLLK